MSNKLTKPKKPKPPTPREPVAQQPLHTRTLKWGGGLLSLLLAVSGVLPLFQIPSVDSPTQLDPSNPYSLPFLIKNNSVLPIWGIEYSCTPNIKAVDGGLGHLIVNYKTFKKGLLLSGQQITAVCAGIGVVAPRHYISAIVALNLTYHHALWPFAWTSHYPFVAYIDPGGTISRWFPE